MEKKEDESVQPTTCPMCNGEGRDRPDKTCPQCNGTGVK